MREAEILKDFPDIPRVFDKAETNLVEILNHPVFHFLVIGGIFFLTGMVTAWLIIKRRTGKYSVAKSRNRVSKKDLETENEVGVELLNL